MSLRTTPCTRRTLSLLVMGLAAAGGFVLGPRRPPTRLASLLYSSTEEEHLVRQVEAFDSMAVLFTLGLQPETEHSVRHLSRQFLKQMAEKRGSQDGYKLLDVGCGAGLLFGFLLQAAQELGWKLDITGVDISPAMVNFAKDYAGQLMEDMGEQHAIEVLEEDAVKYLRENIGTYDGIIANRCFGNFWDPQEAVDAMAGGLRENGVLCISHPAGAEFVEEVRRKSPEITLNGMPTIEELTSMIAPGKLQLLEFTEEVDWADAEDGERLPIYYASAVKSAE